MKSKIILPSAIQICVDDVGWFKGADDRYLSRPSRTGMTRAHYAEDYVAINEVGKAIGQKIMCPLVLAEWDRENILRGEVGITYQPHTWDRASELNLRVAEKCFEAAESSEYIEYAVHGVLHGNYDKDGKQITEQEFFEYKNPEDTLLSTQSEDEIAHRFELFFKLYDMWGFKKKIRSFAAPNSLPGHLEAEDLLPLAAVLKKYGINYWANYWKKQVGYTTFIDGILYMDKCTNCHIPWNACDVDPLLVHDFAKEGDESFGTVVSTHWPNFLRYNKEHNLDRVNDWATFFKRQSEIFGLMVSKDIAFAGNQCIYRNYSKVDVEKNIVKIDVTKASTISPKHTFGEFYISLKNELVPKNTIGGTLELYETHKEFKTYKIKHTENTVELELY